MYNNQLGLLTYEKLMLAVRIKFHYKIVKYFLIPIYNCIIIDTVHYSGIFPGDIPKADRYHHVVEDFVTDW